MENVDFLRSPPSITRNYVPVERLLEPLLSSKAAR